MNYFAGVDPSITNTGIVVLDQNMEVEWISESSQIVSNKVVRSTQSLRLQALKEYLENTLKRYEGLSVAYEHYSFQSTNKAFSLGELGGVYKLALFEMTGEDPVLVPPGILKKFATGHGSASKEGIIRAAINEGLGHYDDDICDAFFLAKFCYYRICPEEAIKLDSNKKLVRNRLNLTQKEI
ncbi:MAG: crossover junction endodeoxyribonuclease RuvC [Elusimicrobiota bacterium]